MYLSVPLYPRKLLTGVKQFNLDPDRGLKFLQEAGFIEPNPQSTAKFLFRQERLSKKQIGRRFYNIFVFLIIILPFF